MATDSSSNPTYVMPTYAPQNIRFTKGEGSWLYTSNGDAYLDALTGIAVCGLGHCPPDITHAISDQAARLIHTSNLYHIDWQEKAAELLCKSANMDSVFFGNSGAEANEAALKMARLYGHKKGYRKPKVIVMQQSFHGRTLLTVSATANPKAREGFYALNDDFIRVPFGDIEAIKQAGVDFDEITAVLLEPIQGEGGLNLAKDGFGYLEQVGDVCAANDWLFMLDEVQTGNGRTGEPFAYQHSHARPDVLTTAKGLGNGYPVGACMVSGKANGLLTAGSHGSTYGGSPLASRVVYTVYDLLMRSNVMQNAVVEGDYLQLALRQELADFGVTTRGHGMMIGVVLPEDMNCQNLVNEARDQQKLIINVTGGHVIRLLPALNLTREDNNQIVERLVAMLKPKLQ